MSILQKKRFDLIMKSDSGKMSFLMIAEIILITLGITLALKVDEWSAQREDEETKVEYLNDLHEELQSDILFYDHYNDIYKFQAESIYSTYQVLNNGFNDEVDTKDFAQTCVNGLNFGAWNRTPIVWEELKTTGKRRHIDNKSLLIQLHSYYNKVEELHSGVLLSLHKSILDIRDVYMKEFDIKHVDELLADSTVFILESKPSNESVEVIFSDMELQKNLKKCYAYYRAAILNQNRFMSEAQALSDAILLEVESIK